MAKPKIGVREAAKLLQGMGSNSSGNLLDIIAQKDPEMAEQLKQNMVVFDDLQYLTVSMIVDLFKEIDTTTMGLALRMASEELKNHILNNVSSSMRGDMEDVLKGPPRRASEVQEAVDKVMTLVRHRVETGEINFKSADGDEWV